MPRKKKQDEEVQPSKFPNTGNESIPPGATKQAADREIHAGGGRPGSGAGPRHAAADEGSVDEEYGGIDVNEPAAVGPLPDPTDELNEEEAIAGKIPYAGVSGGAVGGAVAEMRASGGDTHGGIAPGGAHRGDSTIGQDPDDNGETPPPEKRRPQKG